MTGKVTPAELRALKASLGRGNVSDWIREKVQEQIAQHERREQA